MQSAVAMATEAARARGASHVHVIRMRIGALTGVVKESLEFAFELACQGSMAEGASLEIESIAATGWCASCQAEFAGAADSFWCCPRCQTPSVQLRHGRELELAAIEVS